MSLPADPIPAPGFRIVSGKRGPSDKTAKWQIQLRTGHVDDKHSYTADQIDWVHYGGGGDVVAVRKL